MCSASYFSHKFTIASDLASTGKALFPVLIIAQHSAETQYPLSTFIAPIDRQIETRTRVYKIHWKRFFTLMKRVRSKTLDVYTTTYIRIPIAKFVHVTLSLIHNQQDCISGFSDNSLHKFRDWQPATPAFVLLSHSVTAPGYPSHFTYGWFDQSALNHRWLSHSLRILCGSSTWNRDKLLRIIYQ